MAYRRQVQLPRDLLGVIAASVASDPDRESRLQALYDCMLVSRSFAHEFRRHLFETFTISDTMYCQDVEDMCNKLSAHAQTLQDHPEYRKLVKTVHIRLSNQPGERFSIIDEPRFPSWLEGLTSVTSISFGSSDFDSEAIDFTLVLPDSRAAIIQLYSLPTIRRLAFYNIDDLPPQLFRDTPRLEELYLFGAFMDDSYEHIREEEEELKLVASKKPSVHLHLSCTHQNEIPRTLHALLPIILRTSMISAKYDAKGEVDFIRVCLNSARDTLQELDLTLFGGLSPPSHCV